MATGHVRKRGKKWAFVQYVTDPATGEGKYRWKSGFATKSDAQRALREAISATEQGTFIEPSKMSYADYVERLWLPQLDDQLESSTIESYERNMRVHILPRIGGIKLQQLGPIHLNDLYRDLQKQEIGVDDSSNRRHDPKIYPRITYLRSQGVSYTAIAKGSPRNSPTTSRSPRTPSPPSCADPITHRRTRATSLSAPSDTSTRLSAGRSRTP